MRRYWIRFKRLFQRNRKKLVYVASPYIHFDDKVVIQRYEQVKNITKIIVNEFFDELVPFSPIVYTHTMDGADFIDFDWYSFDLVFLYQCDYLFVVEMAGWRDSYGVNLEIDEAQKCGIPIVYVDPDDVVGSIKTNLTNNLTDFAIW